MASNEINVNNTDINSPLDPDTPLDMMGLLFFAYRDFVSDADALLAGQQFGRAHHRVMYFVNIRPGMSVATLLSILKITKQSLARVLRQLIDEGYIEQHPGKSDKRQRLLYATPKGHEFFAVLSKSQTRRINAALAKLPQDARANVRDFLVHMINDKDHQTLKDLKLT